MTDQDVTIGEISRSVGRIEASMNALALAVQSGMTLQAAQGVKIDSEKERVDDLELKVDSLVTRSAFIAGGISALVSAANFLLGRHS